MATMTLVEFKKRTRSELIAGVVEDIYTLNPIWSTIPWIPFSGSGITVNRETTIGDSQFLAIGGTITAKAASAVTSVTFEPTTCIGDAEINNLQVTMSESDINDVVATEISSKAKSVGRNLETGFATGDGSSPNMNSMHSLIDSSQYVTNVSGGANLTFAMLDDVLAKVDSMNGQVGWIQMTQRDFNAYKALLRALGGTAADWAVTLPDGRTTLAYEGIPIFVNRYLSTTETDDGAALTTGAQSSLYCGVWDDGSKKQGAAMIYPKASTMGISVEPIGSKELADEKIFRVKAYTNFAIFNRRGIARLTGLKI